MAYPVDSGRQQGSRVVPAFWCRVKGHFAFSHLTFGVGIG